MWFQNICLVLLGIACGFGIAGGIFALILSLKILPRFTELTNTATHITLYEDSLLLGGSLGNLYYILDMPSISIPHGAGIALTIVTGLFFGIFTGCVSLAIAEIINVFPIMFRRISLKKGMGLVILSVALGKGLGTLLQLMMDWKK